MRSRGNYRMREDNKNFKGNRNKLQNKKESKNAKNLLNRKNYNRDTSKRNNRD